LFSLAFSRKYQIPRWGFETFVYGRIDVNILFIDLMRFEVSSEHTKIVVLEWRAHTLGYPFETYSSESQF